MGKKQEDLLLSIQKPSTELSIDKTIEWIFDLYLKNFIMFFIPILIASLISGVLSTSIYSYVQNMPSLIEATVQEILNWFYTLLGVAFAVGIVSWIIGTIASGTCIRYASDLIEKGTASLGKACNFTIHKMLSLLAAGFIVGLLVGVCFLAFVVPGIILAIMSYFVASAILIMVLSIGIGFVASMTLAVMFSLVMPAILVENVGAFDSLSRSRSLVRRRWLKTFVLFLMISIMVGIVSYIGSLIGAAIGSSSKSFNLGTYSIISSIVTNIAMAFVLPVSPIMLTLHYYSMLAKEEKQRTPMAQ